MSDRHTATTKIDHIRTCERCGLRYDWRRSPSSLKMTYCSSLCEMGALGFTVEALEHKAASLPARSKAPHDAPEAEPVAA